MKNIILYLGVCLFLLVASPLIADINPIAPKPLIPDYAQADMSLPPGVPKEVDTNGNVIYVPEKFTTKAFQAQALDMVIDEANRVADDLSLPEDLPISKTNLVEWYVGPFGFTYAFQKVGNITTKNYVYGVEQGYKFSMVVKTHESETCRKYLSDGYVLPIGQINTNAAVHVALGWFSKLHVDIDNLNRDCHIIANVDTTYVSAPAGNFVPVYLVAWIPNDGSNSCPAYVRLFLPTKSLLNLTIEDKKYILRKKLAFKNMSALFPGTAPIRTNYPVPVQYLGAPP